MAYFHKRYHPPGTAPGTLTEAAAPAPAAATAYRLHLIDYTDREFTEKELADIEECQGYVARPSTTWIHVQGNITASAVRKFGDMFGLHPLAMEDVLNTGQRPKLDRFEEHVFITMALLGRDAGGVVMEQVSLFFGEDFILSFHHGSVDRFEPVRRRLRTASGHIRSLGDDYLLYCLLDLVIDEAFPVLEDFGDRVESLESAALDSPDRLMASAIHTLKRELLMLRRMLWPQRDVVNALLRDDTGMISETTRIYLRDCYDHSVQVIDLIEMYRDITSGMLDVYLTAISNRLNDVMRVLTVIATIFIPLTFITGVYGMNFGNNTSSPWAMPELRWYFGYPLSLLLMLGVAIGMLVYFKRKKWL
jgi:magnesium transporter